MHDLRGNLEHLRRQDLLTNVANKTKDSQERQTSVETLHPTGFAAIVLHGKALIKTYEPCSQTGLQSMPDHLADCQRCLIHSAFQAPPSLIS